MKMPKTNYLGETRWVGLKMEISTFRGIEELQIAHRISRSDVIRHLLREGLKTMRDREAGGERETATK